MSIRTVGYHISQDKANRTQAVIDNWRNRLSPKDLLFYFKTMPDQYAY